MRIFGKVLQTLRFPKRSSSCYKSRQYSNIICQKTPHICPNSIRIVRSVAVRPIGSKSGSNQSLDKKQNSNILPVALIKAKNPSMRPLKIMLIPLNLFEGDDEAAQKTLNSLSIIHQHTRQIEEFSDNLIEPLFPDNTGKMLTNFDGNDETATSLGDRDPKKDRVFADKDKYQIDTHDGFDAITWNTERQILAYVPDKIDERLKQMSISSIQLAFEMDMSNIKDAIVMSFATKNMDWFKPHSNASLTESAMRLPNDAPDQNKTIPLTFSTVIQGIVEIDPSQFTPEHINQIKVPEFNDSVTTIAANICSTALQKGFPADIGRMTYSTKSNTRNPHITCVREGSKGCISPGNAGNPPFIPAGKAETKELKSTSTPSIQTKAEISLLSTSAIIGDYSPRGLMSCKAYARAVIEAAKRREHLKSCKIKEKIQSEESKCSVSRVKTSNVSIEAKKKRKDRCGSTKNNPCGKDPNPDPCKEHKPPKKEPPKKVEKKVDPCKGDPCKKKAAADDVDRCGQPHPCSREKKKPPCGTPKKEKPQKKKNKLPPCKSPQDYCKKKEDACSRKRKKDEEERCRPKPKKNCILDNPCKIDPCKEHDPKKYKCSSANDSQVKQSKSEPSCGQSKQVESTCGPPKKSQSDSKCGSSKKSDSKKSIANCGPKKSESTCGPPKKTDSKCDSPKKTESTCGPPKKTESKCGPPKKTESKCGPPKKTESKCGPPKKTESKCGDTKKTDSKCGAPKKTESKCGPPKKTESKCGAPKKTESKCGDQKKTESKCGAPKKTESKCDASKKSEPKTDPKKPAPKCGTEDKCAALKKPEPKCGAKKSESKCDSPKKSESKCGQSKKSESKCGAPKKTESKCGQPKKSESKCGQPKKSESKCGPPKKSESKCGAPKKTESKCGQPKKSESKCGQPKKSESKCGPPKKSESKCGAPKKTESKCGQPKKSESKCGQPKKSESKCGPPKKSESKCGAPKKTESKCGQPKKSESKCGPPKKSESKCGAPKKTESKCGPPKKSESKCGTPKKSESKCGAPKKTESKCGPPKKSESKCGPPKKSESKCGAPKKTESKCGPPKKSESKCGPPKKSESKCGAPKKTESKCGQPKKSESKCGQPKKSESKCGPPKKSESKCGAPKKTESKCGQPKKSESKCGQPKKSESKCGPPKKSESKCGAPKKTESKCGQPKKSESKCGQPKKSDSKCGSPKKSESKCGAPKKTESKCGQPKKSESKCGQPKKSDSKCGSPKKSESKCGAPKKTESKCGQTKKSESKCAQPKKSESKCGQPKKSDSKSSCGPSGKKTLCGAQSAGKSKEKSAEADCQKSKSKSTKPNCSKKDDPSGSCKKNFSTSATELKELFPVKRSFSTISLFSLGGFKSMRFFASKKKGNKIQRGECLRLILKKPRKRRNIKARREPYTTCYDDRANCPRINCKDPACPEKKKENERSSISQSNMGSQAAKWSDSVQTRSFHTNIVNSAHKRQRKPEDNCKVEALERRNEVVKITAPCRVVKAFEDMPVFNDYDVLLRTEAVALGGSDLHFYETGGRAFPGMTLGHDATGVVEAVGKCIKTLRPGDRVAIEPALSCGICYYCKTGCYSMCNYLIYNGFLSKYQVHPADLCHKVPKGVSIEDSCLTQTLALGCHACLKAQVKPTSCVLIIGSSPTAVSTALCARAIGVKHICMTCNMVDSLDRVGRIFQVENFHLEPHLQYKDILQNMYSRLHDWPDIVVNCAVSERTMNIAVMALKPCGVCILAECDSECICYNAMDVLMKNIKLIPSFRSINMFPTALQLIQSGKAPIGQLVTKVYSWSRVEKAFRKALHESNTGNRKVIVKCTDKY